MTATAEEQPTPTDLLFSPGGADEPRATYEEIRSGCPVSRGEFGGQANAYVARYEDVCWAFRHPEVFSSDAEAMSLGEQPLIPLQVDPPMHTQYRRLLNPEFLPRTVARLESQVRELAAGLVDAFASRGECDFHEELATPLPSTVFLALMGLPQSDLPTFLQWRDDTIRPKVAPGDFEAAERIRAETGKAINAYFERALDDYEAREPDESLMSRIVHGEIDGRRLTRTELLGICHLMLLGGLDTVTATLDCMIVYLAEHPDRRQQLVDDPSLWPSAIEELLRHETPVMMVPRILKQDVVLGGVQLRAGDHATLLIGAANGDPDGFENADDVDLGRDHNKHVAFGGGHHLCLGAHLARLELRIALEEFHARIPNYRVRDGAEIHFSPGIRQAHELPLVFDRT